MSDEIAQLAEKIARKLNFPIEKLNDLPAFLKAVDDYVSERVKEPSLVDVLEKIGFGSKILEEPARFYLLLKYLEEIKYKQGFEDGVKVASKSMSDEETKELRKLQIEMLKNVLDLYQNNITPLLQFMLSAFSNMFKPQQQQQTEIEFK